MSTLRLERNRFLTLHVTTTIVVLACAISYLWITEYPGRFFFWGGAAYGSLLLLILGFCTGPLLTYFVYKPGKKGLLFDLIVIISLQTAASSFASYQIHVKRPQCVILSENTIHLISEREFDLYAVKCPDSKRTQRGIRYFYMDLPDDPDLTKVIKSMSEKFDQIPFYLRTDLYIEVEDFQSLPTNNTENLNYESAFKKGLVPNR